MKETIKNCLFKKRSTILKSRQGFSLIEVLVAVAIIGIISAIAVPQFTANRNEAARVAGDTSVSNILKAFNNCLVLKSFAQCNSLSAIGVNCPDCATEVDGDKFCAHISKGGTATSPDFAACVSIDTSKDPQEIGRSYGGKLLKGKICHDTHTADTSGNPGNVCPAKAKSAMSPVKTCNIPGDCGSTQSATATQCGITYQCETGGTGKCNGSGVCG